MHNCILHQTSKQNILVNIIFICLIEMKINQLNNVMKLLNLVSPVNDPFVAIGLAE